MSLVLAALGILVGVIGLALPGASNTGTASVMLIGIGVILVGTSYGAFRMEQRLAREQRDAGYYAEKAFQLQDELDSLGQKSGPK